MEPIIKDNTIFFFFIPYIAGVITVYIHYFLVQMKWIK